MYNIPGYLRFSIWFKHILYITGSLLRIIIFRIMIFLFLFVLAAVCDCDIPWTFLLTFYPHVHSVKKYFEGCILVINRFFKQGFKVQMTKIYIPICSLQI